VHLVEEAFGIPVGTFDAFFSQNTTELGGNGKHVPLQPQHRIKLIKYPPIPNHEQGQGVGAHKDSSGWLTFLYQVGNEEGLEVLSSSGEWIAATPIEGTFVVNFGNAFEAATEGAVKATVHRVQVRICDESALCNLTRVFRHQHPHPIRDTLSPSSKDCHWTSPFLRFNHISRRKYGIFGDAQSVRMPEWPLSLILGGTV